MKSMRMKVIDVKTARHKQTLLEIDRRGHRHLMLLETSGSQLVVRRSVLMVTGENNTASK